MLQRILVVHQLRLEFFACYWALSRCQKHNCIRTCIFCKPALFCSNSVFQWTTGMVKLMVIAMVNDVPDQLVRNIAEDVGGVTTVHNVPEPASCVTWDWFSNLATFI